MVIGTAMAAYEMLAGNASVLYTFYAPLKASPYFYLGATLAHLGHVGRRVRAVRKRGVFQTHAIPAHRFRCRSSWRFVPF